MNSPTESLTWTTEDNPEMFCRRQIATGGYGTVYEVLSKVVLSHRQIFDRQENKVNLLSLLLQ